MGKSGQVLVVLSDSEEVPGTTFVNASVCNERYCPDNAPWHGVLSR